MSQRTWEAVAVGEPAPEAMEFLPPAPNPVRQWTRVRVALPTAQSRVELP